MSEAHACCHADNQHPKRWYQRILNWALTISVVLLSFSYLVPAFASFHQTFFDYLKIMALPLLMGLLVGGVLDHYVSEEYVSKLLAAKTKRTVFYAVGLGLLMSACSHGILALSMELHKKGASGPAVVSFLLASPWSNLSITFLLLGFFGWKAFVIILSAILIAIITGVIFQVLDHHGLVEHNPHSVKVAANFSIKQDLAQRLKRYQFSAQSLRRDIKGIAKGAWGLVDMILGWILIGVILAGLSATFITPNLFQQYMGPTLFGLMVTVIAATVLEVCSEGTSPLAFEIYRQTGAFGNAFAFLMGGVVTDYTEIALVWRHLGKRTALWMVGLSLPQVIALAWLYNQLL